MKTLLISSIVAGLALAGSVALAGPHGPGHRGKNFEALFEKLDTNKDGKLSRAEFGAHRARLFERADANKDQIITLEEMKQAGKAMRDEHRAERFAKLDKNGDGNVSKTEAGHMPERRFNHFDSNRDGTISASEFSSAKGPSKGKHRQARGADRAAKMFERLDANKDGKLTRAEATSGDKRFERMDANGDGYLTKDELKKAHTQAGNKGKGQSKKDKQEKRGKGAKSQRSSEKR